MRLFSVSGPLAPDSFLWQLSTDPQSTVGLGIQLAPADPAHLLAVLNHKLFNQSMGWVGYQRQLYAGTATTTVQVTVSAPPLGPQQTLIYLVFADCNAVVQFRPTSPTTFSLSNVPLGTAAAVVVLRGTGGKLYLGLKRCSPQTSASAPP